MHLKNKNLGYGLHNLILREKKALHMDLDLYFWKAKKNMEKIFWSNDGEMIILLLEGKSNISINDQKENVFQRKNLFDELGAVIHVFQNSKIKIKTLLKSEFLILKTDNHNLGKAKIYDKDNSTVKNEFFGKDIWDNTALRNVRTYIDYDNKPESNLVIGEVITYPGRWSSFIPHYHPQPELYFFKFDKKQGFGISVAGENAYIVRNNDVNAIPANLVHPVSAAPGYPLYYCWILKHLKNNPWTQRIELEEHLWLKKENVKYWGKNIKGGKNEK